MFVVCNCIQEECMRRPTGPEAPPPVAEHAGEAATPAEAALAELTAALAAVHAQAELLRADRTSPAMHAARARIAQALKAAKAAGTGQADIDTVVQSATASPPLRCYRGCSTADG